MYRCIAAGAEREIGYDAAYFEQLAPVEETHFWFVSRNALLNWALRRYFPEARAVLEAGCGSGQVARALQRANPGLRITGTEAFLEGLETAAARVPDAEFVQADIRQLPFDREFDVVGAFDVLEHVPEDDAALREMVKAVKPGGGVIVTVPQHPFLWSTLDQHAGHIRRYSRASLTARLEEAGLRVERTTSFVSLLLPAMIVSRLLQHGRPSMREFHVAGPVNRLAGVVMACERWLIAAGVSMPVGGSLLVVARRPG